MDRFSEPLTAAQRDHLDGCARCQTEAALWTEFNDAALRPEEGADVQWIVKELERRRATPAIAARPGGVGRWLALRPLSAIAAALAVAVTVGYVARDREPNVPGTGGVQQTYRTSQLQLIAPAGDQPAVPRHLEWRAVGGAVEYHVTIIEVDRSVLWRGSSSGPQLALPSSAKALLVPGKTVLWEVTALDATGKIVAASGMQPFRVIVN